MNSSLHKLPSLGGVSMGINSFLQLFEIWRNHRLELFLHNKSTFLVVIYFSALFMIEPNKSMAITMGEVRAGVVPSQSGGRGSASNLQNAGAASAAMTATLARQSIQRSDTAVGAMRAMQRNAAAAARAATRTGNPTLPNGQTVNGSAVIPNGLAENWLHPHDGFDGNGKPLTTSWRGASINMAKTTPASSSGDHHVEITQSEQNAYLYWKNFNVGPRTTINFDQSKGGADAGKWIAFNKITGNVSPSSIYGKITAPGQVYILNQNGIMFNNGSEVNVHALVASTLPINPYFAGDPMNAIEGRGLLNNTDYQFLFSALKLKKTPSYEEIWDPGNGTPIAASAIGGLKLEKGASISTAKLNGGTGGRVMLVGPSVRNDGTISTPEGQTILAAGLQVGVNAHPSSDPSLRGLDVYIGRVVDDADRSVAKSFSTDQSGNRVGMVDNHGLIETPRGHAAMVGRDLTQNGIIASSTSVTLNGRIDMQAAFNAEVSANKPSGLHTPYFYNSLVGEGTTGSVVFGGFTDGLGMRNGSVLRILPEWWTQEKVATRNLALPSLVSVTGQSIEFGADTSVLAPGAMIPRGSTVYDMTKAARLDADQSTLKSSLDAGISLRAGNWYRPVADQDGSHFLLAPFGGQSGGRITVANGTVISAAGSTGTEVPVERNYVTFDLRGPELADSPLLRKGPLRGQEITVDIRVSGSSGGKDWVGSPVADATGYAALIEREVGELTAAGGSVEIRAGDMVDLQSGSVVDASGGWIRFKDGARATSKLLFRNTITDVSQARNDISYEGIVKGAPVHESGYLEGGAGGSITIQAPAMNISSVLRGTVVTGARQLRPDIFGKAAPTPTLLNLQVWNSAWFRKEAADQGYAIRNSPDAPLVTIAPRISEDQVSLSRIGLDSSLLGSGGIGSLEINNHDGHIVLASGSTLLMGTGGSVTLSAGNIDILGSIVVPGGDISLKSSNLGYSMLNRLLVEERFLFKGEPGKGTVTVGSSSRLSTDGSAVRGYSSMGQAYVADAGDISIQGYNVFLERGSLLGASGGALIGMNGFTGIAYGNAGSISISGGQDADHPTIHDGVLRLGAQLQAYAGVGSRGGNLEINAPAIQIGGTSAGERTLLLDSSFFNNGGFSEFSLGGLGIGQDGEGFDKEIAGVRVVDGTLIQPVVSNRIYNYTGTSRLITLPRFQREAVSLELLSKGLKLEKTVVVQGKVVIEERASVFLDPFLQLPFAGASVPTVKAGSLVIDGRNSTVNGFLSAPGGDISISGAASYPDNYPGGVAPFALPTLRLGSKAVVSTSGIAAGIADPMGLGRNLGAVLSGGHVVLSGNIDLAEGSRVDVSGTSAVLTVPTPRGANRSPYLDSRIESAGGRIELKASEYLVVDGTLLGKSGGKSAGGGDLVVSSGRFYPEGILADPRDISLELFQTREAMATRVESDRDAAKSLGYFAAETAMQGGFDGLELGGNVRFNGDVSIGIDGILRAATGGVISADGAVVLRANHVAIGMPMQGPMASGDPRINNVFGLGNVYEAPSGGAGSIVVEADSVDVGNLLFRNIGTATISAGNGEIRGAGALSLRGALVMKAARIYPATASRLWISVYDGVVPGSITVQQSGSLAGLPLSAGGTLSLHASSIIQNGTLLAPLGTINLGWDGTGSSPIDPITGAGTSDPKTPAAASLPKASLVTLESGRTSVSAVDPDTGKGAVIPYGLIMNGTQWIDPSGNDISSSGLPTKGVNLSAASIVTAPRSVIDLRGGGEVTAYQWIKGLGGNVDITSSKSGSYAILPGYESSLAPVLAFADAGKTGGDSGYTFDLVTGDRISLSGGSGLSAGTYTLLPARYALLPGAFLVSPTGDARELRPASMTLPGGESLVAGYRFNTLGSASQAPVIESLYKVTPASSLAQMAEYLVSTSSSFLPKERAASPVKDAAQLVINATSVMDLRGGVRGAAGPGGSGAIIDLASSRNFSIGRGANPTDISLDPSVLSSWSAGSLLVGGTRQISQVGTLLKVSTASISVDNSGSALTASDLILASRDGIFLGKGSEIRAVGTSPTDPVSVEGDGTLLRLSAGTGSIVTRNGITQNVITGYRVDDDVVLSGDSVILDSSGKASVSSRAQLDGDSLALSAGRIAVSFDGKTDSDALNLTGDLLTGLYAASELGLAGYSQLLFSGNGTLGSLDLKSLVLDTPLIMGDGAARVGIQAANLVIRNSTGMIGVVPPLGTGSGQLDVSVTDLEFGSGKIGVTSFGKVSFKAAGGVAADGAADVRIGGNLDIETPFLTASSGSDFSLGASGRFAISRAAGHVSVQREGAGASVRLSGESLAIAAPVIAPAGLISMDAGAGGLAISSTIDAAGTTKRFFDTSRSLDAGMISIASGGDVILSQGALLDIKASPGGGSAGTLSLSLPSGNLELSPTAALSASASSEGKGGAFVADLSGLPSGGLDPLESRLTESGFTRSRDVRIRNGDVTVAGAKAHSYSLTADSGSITVTGLIDASGETGGKIGLYAGKSVLIKEGAILDASGDEFDSAGKGGYVTLEAGNNPSLGSVGIAATGASGSFSGNAWVVDLAGGSLIDLTVDEVPGLGQSAGRLHLRAPQTANASDVQVNPIGGEIKGASAIEVEGVFRQDAAFDGIASIDSSAPSWNNTTSYTAGTTVLFNGLLYTAKVSTRNNSPPNTTFWSPSTDTSFKQKALNNASAFMANAGGASARILSSIPADKKSLFQINPGEEIINSKGGLLLNNDWNLSTARYGDSLSVLNNQGNPTGATTGRNAGFLTLRAKDDITFNGSLSDGFGTSVSGLYFAQLLPLVKDGQGATLSQSSWSYRIAAGGDFNSADPLAVKGNGTGSVNVGKPTKNSNAIKPSTSDGNALNSYTPDALAGNYQVIRTGTGDISVAAGGDIRLRNQFATIYTAGARTTDPRLGGTFDSRSIDTSRGQTGPFGRYQQPANYAPQYPLGGGNVSLSAGGDIEHVQLAFDDSYIPDSSRQLPVNWLSRRGQTDGDGNWMTLYNGEVASTTWWVNFANFFQGVGALGGGNVSMLAGGNVSNVDAMIPTQGRVTARDRSGKLLAPSEGVLVETGGGDLTVEAAGNIDAGVYYVERGDATIKAGGDIISNRTRDAEGRYLSSLIETSFANDNSRANPAPESWLPTSFFLGKGNIKVTAGGDALLGPVGNVFLLPQGINDGLFTQGGIQVYYRNYFSTYAAESAMSALSLGGNISFRTQLLDLPAFQKWMVANRTSDSVSPSNPGKPGDYQPWLRISEFAADAPDLGSAASLLPASIDLASVSGSIDLQGNLTLSPAARGGLSLLSATLINGVSRQQEGVRWSASVINISDSSPDLLPSVRAPLSAALMRNDPTYNYLTSPSVFLREFSYSLQETASYTGANAALQGKIARHDQGLLHAGDADPVRIYALGGDLSGLGVFSPKATRVLAGGDIRDISLSIQHLSSADLSVVSAGGDLRPFDENTPRLEEASRELDRFNQPADWAYRAQPRSGDIQISGPGMLQVLAGGHIDLGTGDVNSDGTGVGITSIGNARNPALPFDGASIIAVAGMSLPSGLGSGDLRSVDLLEYFAPVDAAGRYFSQLIPMLNSQGDSLLAARVEGAGSLGGILRHGMDDESMARIALSLFYVVLRDTGRDRNDPASPDYGTYRNGIAAIDRFLPTGSGHGDIILNARDIRTKSGGGIDLVAPRGGISLANYAVSESLTPPGIVTESGGGVNIFSRDDVSLGIGRIFTLRGGDVMIWSDKGDIAAGSSAKTVQSAPPTRVLIDPQSGDVETDLAGIATGGGIGVLATVAGVAPSNVDLIAPTGVIDAGDAGIRSTGNLNLAARKILNADNILAGGVTVGAPPPAAPSAPPAAAPPPAAPPAGATAAAAAGNSAAENAGDKNSRNDQAEGAPSIISVDVLGYGGGDGDGDDEKIEKSVKQQESEQGTKQAAL
jgi:filamentous hemagglutinin